MTTTSELPPHISDVLERLLDAAGPLRVFSARDAADAGLETKTVQRLVATGHLQRIERGWYTQSPTPLTPWELHLRRTHAIVRGRRGKAAASGQSALVVHGLPVFRPDWPTVHVTYRDSSTYRRRVGCVSHAADVSTGAEAGVRLVRPEASGGPEGGGALGIDASAGPGTFAVSEAFAVIQAGLTNGALTTLVAGDAALHRNLVTREDLEAAAAAYARTAGITPVAAIIELLDGRSESPPESLARFAFHSLGFHVVPQVEIRVAGRLYRADLALLEPKLLIEIDGALKYAGPDAQAVIMAEKHRHTNLRAAGWRIVRLTWDDIVGPGGQLRFDHLRGILARELIG